MGFFGGIFKVLGFESEGGPKKKKKKTKGTYKLKEGNDKPNQIDGVPVYYPENFEQTKEFLLFIKQKKAIILSLTYINDLDTVEDYIDGFVAGSSSKKIALNDEELYLILPEGMEIEE